MINVEQQIAELRKPLFAYMYRMVTHRDDAEDLLQDVLVRVMEGLPAYRADSSFKTWLFGIATHVCLDHLRRKQRWRVEAKLIGEQEAHADPAELDRVAGMLANPGFVFEIREHIAFCFSCVARTLDPEEQAAIMLREVLGFSNQEAATIMSLSEPVFRHKLSAARATMANEYTGLCRLISKGGACWQCDGLRSFAPEQNRGADLVQIELRPGITLSAESLLDSRLEIVREADLEGGRTRTLHDDFFASISAREESANRPALRALPAP